MCSGKFSLERSLTAYWIVHNKNHCNKLKTYLEIPKNVLREKCDTFSSKDFHICTDDNMAANAMLTIEKDT